MSKRHELLFALHKLFKKSRDSSNNEFESSQYPRSKKTYDKYKIDGKRVVRNTPLCIFQEQLAENFNIQFKQNNIVWPISIKTPSTI